MSALDDFATAATAASGSDPHAAAIAGGISSGIAGGVVAGEVASTAAAIGVGAAIGNAIPIPFVGAAIGALVGAIVAAVNSGSLSPEEAKLRIDQLEAHPEALLWLITSPGDPRPHGLRLSQYRWLYDRAGVAQPSASFIDLPSWGDVAGPVLQESVSTGVNDVTVSTPGQESQYAARALLRQWGKDEDGLRRWIEESTSAARGPHASPELRRWAGWRWPAHVAKAAGFATLVGVSAWQGAFMHHGATLLDALDASNTLRGWEQDPEVLRTWAAKWGWDYPKVIAQRASRKGLFDDTAWQEAFLAGSASLTTALAAPPVISASATTPHSARSIAGGVAVVAGMGLAAGLAVFLARRSVNPSTVPAPRWPSR